MLVAAVLTTVCLLAGVVAADTDQYAGEYVVRKSTRFRAGPDLRSEKLGVLKPGLNLLALEARWVESPGLERRLRLKFEINGVTAWVSERSKMGSVLLERAADQEEDIQLNVPTRLHGEDSAATLEHTEPWNYFSGARVLRAYSSGDTAAPCQQTVAPGSVLLGDNAFGTAFLPALVARCYANMSKNLAARGLIPWPAFAILVPLIVLLILYCGCVRSNAPAAGVLTGEHCPPPTISRRRAVRRWYSKPHRFQVAALTKADVQRAIVCKWKTPGGIGGSSHQKRRWEIHSAAAISARVGSSEHTGCIHHPQPQQYIQERGFVLWHTQPEEAAAIATLSRAVKHLRTSPYADAFLTEGCLYRYLRAEKGDVDSAARMLGETVQWRSLANPSHLDCDLCCERAGSHTWRQVGFDRRARPVVYSCPKQEPPGTKQVEWPKLCSLQRISSAHVVYLRSYGAVGHAAPVGFQSARDLCS
jgi:hypothetical protein